MTTLSTLDLFWHCVKHSWLTDRLDRLFWSGYLTSGSSSTAGESISDSSGYPALIGGKTSSDGNFGVCCEPQLQIGLAVRIDADAQQAGQVDALGSTGASSQDACQSAVLVARAAVLQDAHRMGGGSSWHIGWARAAVTMRGADAAASRRCCASDSICVMRCSACACSVSSDSVWMDTL